MDPAAGGKQKNRRSRVPTYLAVVLSTPFWDPIVGWDWCTTHFKTYFSGDLGCSLGVRDFDPWPLLLGQLGFFWTWKIRQRQVGGGGWQWSAVSPSFVRHGVDSKSQMGVAQNSRARVTQVLVFGSMYQRGHFGTSI